jgi:hypothetical protein
MPCGNACGWLRHFFFNSAIEDAPGNGALFGDFQILVILTGGNQPPQAIQRDSNKV